MLLLRPNILCCDIRNRGSQYSWDTHIVYNSEEDVRSLPPKGHTEEHQTNNGEPALIDIMEHGCHLTQRVELGAVRQ